MAEIKQPTPNKQQTHQEIMEQVQKLAMGYETKTVHQVLSANNTVISSTADIVQIPGNVDALRLWREILAKEPV